jgi:hypothetical protein
VSAATIAACTQGCNATFIKPSTTIPSTTGPQDRRRNRNVVIRLMKSDSSSQT